MVAGGGGSDRERRGEGEKGVFGFHGFGSWIGYEPILAKLTNKISARSG